MAQPAPAPATRAIGPAAPVRTFRLKYAPHFGMFEQSAGKDLVAALRYTRGHAIVSGEEQALELNIETNTYTAPERPAEELPGKMELRLVTAAEEQTSQTTGRIRFYPDGSSTGGKVRLISGEREWQVQVGWLTGEVRLREATP
mgnify:CR=1 FL=1